MAEILFENRSGFDIERSGLFHPIALIVKRKGAAKHYDLLNSASTYGDGDVQIRVHANKTGFELELGSSPTLLNASSATNVIYRLDGKISKKEIDKFNTLRLFQRKFQFLEEKGIDVKYQSMLSDVFEQNLMLIDTMMPDLLAELLLMYYSEPASALAEIIELIEKKNPLGFPGSSAHKFYEFKIKRLLCDIALGMMPATPWSGYYDATGGYVIVKEDGNIVCYHIYNKNQLEEYLLNNTKFETGSTSRHEFGKIYSNNGGHYLKLNAQIRFN